MIEKIVCKECGWKGHTDEVLIAPHPFATERDEIVWGCPKCRRQRLSRQDKSKCPSCGVSYVKHMGLIGTCKELQLIKEAARRFIYETSGVPMRAVDCNQEEVYKSCDILAKLSGYTKNYHPKEYEKNKIKPRK